MEKKKTIAILAAVIVLLVLGAALVHQDKKDKETSPQPQPAGQASEAQGQKLQEGAGDRVVKAGDTIAVNYVGTLQDGTTFDSNVTTTDPFEFQIGVGRVIKGWDTGLIGMKVGEKRKLVIAPKDGYGDQAVGKIPANSTLIFDVQLLEIK
jgi:FKBP-type peptidyl-prolyl cis-trans isomerase